MSVHPYVIRDATKEDCEAIHRLIVELATYEKAPENSITNTVQGLKDDGFGEKSFFNCLVVETNCKQNNDKENSPKKGSKHEERVVIGYALYFFGYSTWNGRLVYLEDLYISPDHRRAGLGTALIRRVARIGVDAGCQRMQWAVLGWNTGARKLYDKIGAKDLTELEDWHLTTLQNDKFMEFVQQEMPSNCIQEM